MAFTDLKQPELKAIAEAFGVDVPSGIVSNASIIEALEAEGVTFEEYERVNNLEHQDVEEAVKEQPATVGKPAKHDPLGDEVLIRMRRDNMTFEAYGTKFTKEHPFQVVSREQANNIFEHFEGFTSATPKELEDYYS